MSSAIISAIRVENGIFWFDLEETIVSTIRQHYNQQSQHSPTLVLGVPRYLRRWLRKASVFDITEETSSLKTPKESRLNASLVPPPKPPTWQSGITFISRYRSPSEKGTGAETWVCVLETIVSLDGDVVNKVQQQFLDSEKAVEISTAHFWLIDQLLLTLRQDTDLFLKIITWVSLSFPPISLGVISLWNNCSLEITDTIAPLIGTGFSSLAYSVKDYWKPWIHKGLSRWLGAIVKKQLGFS